MIWSGISWDGPSSVSVSMTGQWNRDEILYAHVRLQSGAAGSSFISMAQHSDNACMGVTGEGQNRTSGVASPLSKLELDRTPLEIPSGSSFSSLSPPKGSPGARCYTCPRI